MISPNGYNYHMVKTHDFNTRLRSVVLTLKPRGWGRIVIWLWNISHLTFLWNLHSSYLGVRWGLNKQYWNLAWSNCASSDNILCYVLSLQLFLQIMNPQEIKRDQVSFFIHRKPFIIAIIHGWTPEYHQEEHTRERTSALLFYPFCLRQYRFPRAYAKLLKRIEHHWNKFSVIIFFCTIRLLVWDVRNYGLWLPVDIKPAGVMETAIPTGPFPW